MQFRSGVFDHFKVALTSWLRHLSTCTRKVIKIVS
jgi:hypothetical protein